MDTQAQTEMSHKAIQQNRGDDHRQSDDVTEEHFLKDLYLFMKKRDTPIERIPNLGFKQIDLYLMYKTVQELGGYHQVTAQQLWKQVYNILGGNPRSTSAATCTRRHYEKLMLPYECHVKGLRLNSVLPLRNYHYVGYRHLDEDGPPPAKLRPELFSLQNAPAVFLEHPSGMFPLSSSYPKFYFAPYPYTTLPHSLMGSTRPTALARPPPPSYRTCTAPAPHSVQHPPPVPHSVECPPQVPHSVERPPQVLPSIERLPPIPHSVKCSRPVAQSAERSPLVLHSVERPPQVPLSREHLPPIPASIERPPPVPHSIERPPPVPHSIERPPPVPHSAERSPLVPHSVECPPQVPHSIERPPPVPHSVQRPLPVPPSIERLPPVSYSTEYPKDPLEHLRCLAKHYESLAGLSEPLNLSVKAAANKTTAKPVSSFAPPSSKRNLKFLNKPSPLYTSQNANAKSDSEGDGAAPSFVSSLKDSIINLDEYEEDTTKSVQTPTVNELISSSGDKRESMEIEIPLSVFNSWLQRYGPQATLHGSKQMLIQENSRTKVSEAEMVAANMTFEVRQSKSEEKGNSQHMPRQTSTCQVDGPGQYRRSNPNPAYGCLTNAGGKDSAVLGDVQKSGCLKSAPTVCWDLTGSSGAKPSTPVSPPAVPQDLRVSESCVAKKCTKQLRPNPEVLQLGPSCTLQLTNEEVLKLKKFISNST